MNGWGPKSSVCPSKHRETKLLGGISRDFAGISREHPKSLRTKGLCSILVPQSVPFSCLLVLEKQALLSTLRSVLPLPYRIFLAVVNLLQGNPKGGLANGAWPERRQLGQKGPFRGTFSSSPVAVGCGGIGPDRPRKGPDRPRKGPNQPRKGPISQKGFPPDFSENLGLKPPFVSPPLDFPNCSPYYF